MNDPLDRITETRFDCVVVGAGPAGSFTARELARRGASVLLVDKATFPRPKVCGCCVNPRALETLESADLGFDRLGRKGFPLTSLELACNGRRAVIHQALGVAISRESFDSALVDAAIDAGAEFLPATTATVLNTTSREDRQVRLRQLHRECVVQARHVVSATGLAGSLVEGGEARRPVSSHRDRRVGARLKIGAGALAQAVPDGYAPHRVYMACGEEGYVGLVALEDGRLDVAAALAPEAIRKAGGIGPLVERILGRSGLPPVPGVADLPWKGTPTLTRTPQVLADDRVFRVGDAAGYVEPFTGEGIAWALAGGKRLAAILASGSGPEAGTEERLWTQSYRHEIRDRQLICRSARLALQTPWLTRSLVHVLSHYPALASPCIRATHRVS